MADASLSTYWQLAGDRFGFRAITPYLLSLDKAVIAVDALLPDFGAPNGMLLVTDYDLLKPHLQEIQSAGYGFSVLTAKLADPSLAELVYLLSDWGWSGSGAAPPWLCEG